MLRIKEAVEEGKSPIHRLFPNPPQLCKSCLTLLSTEGAVEQAVSTYLIFTRSKEALCYEICSLCVLLHNIAVEYYKPAPISNSTDFSLRDFDSYKYELDQSAIKGLEIGIYNKKLGIERGQAMMITASADDPVASYVPIRPFQSKLDDDSIYTQAQNWLDECNHSGSHSKCKRYVEEQLPTRVISVQGIPKIHLSRKGEVGCYATLSYCWGVKDQAVMLQQDNMSELIEKLPMSKLPTVIHDAITVAQKLGIPYLWIDSLCIVQNSKADKRKEISNMRNIYEKSYVTITASSSETCEISFVKARLPEIQLHRTLLPIGFVSKLKTFPSFQIPFCYQNTVGTIILQPWYGHDSLNEAVYLRAWTLEEHLLSPRVLTYGRSQLLWDCNSTSKCNGGLRFDSDGYPLEKLRSDFGESIAQNGADSRHDYWESLVRNYTARQLTHQHDRLNAISGISNKLGSTLFRNYVYLAGLWRDKKNDVLFLRHLLWRSSNDEKPIYEDKSVTNWPSWCWASTVGGISCRGWRTDHQLIDVENAAALSTVVECHVDLQSSIDAYGPINGGHLIMCGPAIEITCQLVFEPQSEGAWWRNEYTDSVIASFLDAFGKPQNVTRHLGFVLDIELDDRPGLKFSDSASIKFHALFLMKFISPLILKGMELTPCVRFAGLLLIGEEKEGKTVYRRFGIFSYAQEQESGQQVEIEILSRTREEEMTII